MNSIFTQKVYPGGKPINWYLVVPVCVVLCMTVVLIPVVIAVFILYLVTDRKVACLDCKATNRIFKSYIAFRCYNCQAINALRNNKWQLVDKNKITQASDKSKEDQYSYDELERIAQLKDKGIITTEEFNVKKKKLLEI